MKKLFVIIVFVSTALVTHAQTEEKTGGKFNFGIQAGNINNGDYYYPTQKYSTQFGVSLKYEYPIASKLFVTGETGFTHLRFGKERRDLVRYSGYNYIPLKGGVKYYFFKNVFAEAQAGGMFGVSKFTRVDFVYSPSIGITFKNGIEVGAKYEVWNQNYNNLKSFGARVGFRF